MCFSLRLAGMKGSRLGKWTRKREREEKPRAADWHSFHEQRPSTALSTRFLGVLAQSLCCCRCLGPARSIEINLSKFLSGKFSFFWPVEKRHRMGMRNASSSALVSRRRPAKSVIYLFPLLANALGNYAKFTCSLAVRHSRFLASTSQHFA